MKNVVLLLAENRGISTYPPVFQCARELKRIGCKITIITKSEIDDDSLKEFFDDYIYLSNNEFSYELAFVTKELLKRNTDIVIAFEPRDAKNAVIASIIKRKCKYVYYNLEVLDNTHIDAAIGIISKIKAIIFKKMEIIYLARCCCMVIQDNIRMILANRFGLAHSNTFLIPNSYNYFSRDSFDVNAKKWCSVLYAGTLEEWSIKSIIEQVDKFKQINLTLSGWSRDGFINKYLENKGVLSNININMNKYSYTDYIELVKKYDIGLVWYSSTSDNIANIGMSSGKYFMYLSCCKPVIVQNLPGISDDVIKYQFGVVIDSLSELQNAVDQINGNYAFYCNNISKYYPVIYAYDVVSKPFMEFITL